MFDERYRNSLYVVPTKAGTHNHRELYGEESSFGIATFQIEKSRGMGPGLRRDDTDVVASGASTHAQSHYEFLLVAFAAIAAAAVRFSTPSLA